MWEKQLPIHAHVDAQTDPRTRIHALGFYKLMYKHHCIDHIYIYMHVRLLVASANLDVLRDPRMSHDVYREHGKRRHAELTEHWLRTGLESALTSHWLRTHCALTKRAHVALYPP